MLPITDRLITLLCGTSYKSLFWIFLVKIIIVKKYVVLEEYMGETLTFFCPVPPLSPWEHFQEQTTLPPAWEVTLPLLPAWRAKPPQLPFSWIPSCYLPSFSLMTSVYASLSSLWWFLAKTKRCIPQPGKVRQAAGWHCLCSAAIPPRLHIHPRERAASGSRQQPQKRSRP